MGRWRVLKRKRRLSVSGHAQHPGSLIDVDSCEREKRFDVANLAACMYFEAIE